MIKQTNEKLLKVVQKYGCYFLSLAEVYEQESNTKWKPKEINKAWKKCKKIGAVNGNDDIVRARIKDIYKVFSKIKRAGVLGDFCYTFDNGNKLMYGSTTNTLPNYFIGRFYNPRTHYTHFVKVSNVGDVLWDSFGSSITVKEGSLQDTRCIYVRRK